jgi:hypothetical protein
MGLGVQWDSEGITTAVSNPPNQEQLFALILGLSSSAGGCAWRLMDHAKNMRTPVPLNAPESSPLGGVERLHWLRNRLRSSNHLRGAEWLYSVLGNRTVGAVFVTAFCLGQKRGGPPTPKRSAITFFVTPITPARRELLCNLRPKKTDLVPSVNPYGIRTWAETKKAPQVFPRCPR